MYPRPLVEHAGQLTQTRPSHSDGVGDQADQVLRRQALTDVDNGVRRADQRQRPAGVAEPAEMVAVHDQAGRTSLHTGRHPQFELVDLPGNVGQLERSVATDRRLRPDREMPRPGPPGQAVPAGSRGVHARRSACPGTFFNQAPNRSLRQSEGLRLSNRRLVLLQRHQVAQLGGGVLSGPHALAVWAAEPHQGSAMCPAVDSHAPIHSRPSFTVNPPSELRHPIHCVAGRGSADRRPGRAGLRQRLVQLREQRRRLGQRRPGDDRP